jgi:hypothetical protein
MMRKVIWTFGMSLLFVASTVTAQSVTSHPGYFPVEELGILQEGEIEVDVNLEGAMLQLAAGAMQEEGEDASLVDLVSSLKRVRVQVGSIEDMDAATVMSRIDDAAGRLTASGWTRMVKVEEDEEQVLVFSREDAGAIVGLTVLVNDGGDEAVVVNIAGTIDPVTLGRIMSMDDMPNLEKYMDAVE